jgi:AhpD family alkylhydroperoxidase
MEISMRKTVSVLMSTVAVALFALAGPASAADAWTYEEAIADVEATLGFVPTFLKDMPKAGFAGAWLQLKELEFGGDTALTAREKALIELGVVSQIPCEYCIWADTEAAKALGASDEQIAEAIAVAATGRFWSTMLNGRQSDFETFKAEFSRLLGTEAAK